MPGFPLILNLLNFQVEITRPWQLRGSEHFNTVVFNDEMMKVPRLQYQKKLRNLQF